jgi:hypothetical protein
MLCSLGDSVAHIYGQAYDELVRLLLHLMLYLAAYRLGVHAIVAHNQM